MKFKQPVAWRNPDLNPGLFEGRGPEVSHPLMNKGWCKALLTLGRVSNLPTLVSNVAAGYSLGGGQIHNSLRSGFVALAAIFCFYEGGMFLNDICDLRVDCRERPKRPLPSGAVSTRTATGVMLGFFVAGLALVGVYLPQALGLTIVLLGLIFAYNLSHTGFAGAPLLMGACRGCVYLIAASAGGWRGPLDGPEVVVMALGLMLYVSWVSFIARDELRGSWGLIPKQKVVEYLLAGISLWDGLVFATVSSFGGMCLAGVCFGGARLWQRRIQST